MANTKLPARLLDTSAIPVLTVTGDLTVSTTTLKVDSTNDRVGIGIASPGRTLHIKDSGQIKLESTSSGGWVGLDFAAGNGTYDGYMGMLDSNGRFFIDVNSNGEDLTILQNGNVGIGTSSPSDPLVVESSGSIGGGSTNANSYFTITDGTYGLYHDPNEIFSDINGTFHIGANHANGALRFHTGGTDARMDIDSSGNVLINSSSVKNLGFTTKVQIEGTGATSASQAIIRNSNSIDPPYLIFGKSRGTSNASNTIVQDNDHLGRIRWMGADGNDMASAAAEINAYVDGTPGSNDMPGALTFSTTEAAAASTTERMRISSTGNVGIGDINPFSKLHVEDTGWSSGAPYGTVAYIQGGATNDANWGHLLISQSGTTTDTGGRLAFGANGENPIAGIRTKYKGATYGDLAFSTRPSGGINTERMVIDSDGTVSTSLGSNVSTVSGSTAQLIHWNPDEILVQDSSTGSASYRDMHSFTAHKSGPLRVRWEAANQSGTYYWAGRFLVDGVQMKKTNGDNALHYFASSLASGNSASVHSFRTFEMDLASVKPGQVIKYQMVSANGSGGPVDGNGQKNRLRTFGVYSSTPTNMGMPIIGYTQGGADVTQQNMTGLTIGSVGVDNKSGIALKTQFALQNEWNDICYVNNAGRTGVTFLLNAVRDLDQNRQKTALVRYAYNQTFTEMAGGHQNTAWEYRYSDNRLQYRFTSAGNYLVQIMVMAGG